MKIKKRIKTYINRIINKPHDFIYFVINKFKNSDVEFYLVDSFEIFHFLPLYRTFISKGFSCFFILEKPRYNTSGKWFDYSNAKSILDKEKLKYRKGCNNKAKIAFTTQRSSLLKKYKKSLKVSVAYGVGMNKDSFALSKDTCLGFDFRLVHGQYMKNIQSEYIDNDKLIIMGYPKHFNEVLYEKETLKSELNIKTSKQILVYFPTWDDDCSVEELYSTFFELKKHYYIVTKLHHCLERLPSLGDKRKKIYEFSDYVLKGNYNFAKAAMLGDVAIVDAKSGASTEVPYINNDIRLVLFTVRKDLNNFYDEINSLAFLTKNAYDVLDLVSKEFNYKKRNEVLEYVYNSRDKDYTNEIVDMLVNACANK